MEAAALEKMAKHCHSNSETQMTTPEIAEQKHYRKREQKDYESYRAQKVIEGLEKMTSVTQAGSQNNPRSEHR